MTAAAIIKLFILKFKTYLHPAGCINKNAIPRKRMTSTYFLSTNYAILFPPGQTTAAMTRIIWLNCNIIFYLTAKKYIFL